MREVERMGEGIDEEGFGSLTGLGGPARQAARALAGTTSAVKDAALKAWADALMDRAPEVMEANAVDMENGRAAETADGLLDRLFLDADRIAAIADGLRLV